MNWIHGFPTIQFPKHVFYPDLLVMTLESIVYTLIKRLIPLSSPWREPLDPDVRWRRRRFNAFFMANEIVEKEDDFASLAYMRIE